MWKEPVTFIFDDFIALTGTLLDSGAVKHYDFSVPVVNQSRINQDTGRSGNLVEVKPKAS
jgi:hypothetical protein